MVQNMTMLVKRSTRESVKSQFRLLNGVGLVFQTEDAKQYYGKSLEKKSKVIANPITSSIPDPYDGEREKRIVAVNRLSQQKNIFMLLRAMKRVLDAQNKR